MRYRDIERRLGRLEAQAPRLPAEAPRHIVVDFIMCPGGRPSAEERQRRIAEAREQARPQDLIIIVDCPTGGGADELRQP